MLPCFADLYSATQPTIKDSTDVKIGCWMGAYPGLTNHFKEASLDAKSNHWDKVDSCIHAAGLEAGGSRP